MVLLAAGLLLAPLAEARPAPALYFLKDGETPTIGDGILNTTLPDGNASKTRIVPVGTESLLPVRFVTEPGAPHPTIIRGPLFVGLWTGESPMLHGNLTATFYLVTGDDMTPLGNASINLDADTESAPDPTALVPPDPTDPEGSVFHIAAQVLPMILKPPTLLAMGAVDMEVPEDSSIVLGFRLEPGSSPGPAPVGAFAQIQYDALLQPSFAYVPWYEPDPPQPAPPASPPSQTPGSGSTTPQPEPSQPTPDSNKDSPGIGLAAVLALAAAALVARRR